MLGGQATERKSGKKKKKKKERQRKAKRTGERQEEKGRPITKEPDHSGIREWGREAERRGRGSYFLWVFERGRRARSVCVRSVVQLINLWQEGFLCSVPWIAALIYMVIFFKTLAAYKKPFISISAKPEPRFCTHCTQMRINKCTGHTWVILCNKRDCMRTPLNFTFPDKGFPAGGDRSARLCIHDCLLLPQIKLKMFVRQQDLASTWCEVLP